MIAEHPCFVNKKAPEGAMESVLHEDTLTRGERIAGESNSVQVLLMHIDRGDAVVFIRIIVVDPLIRAAAGGVQRYLELSVEVAAAARLVDAAQNMEELADALELGAARKGVHSLI